MKISIDTEQDSFQSAMEAVNAAYGQGGTPGTEVEDDDYLPGKWTRRRLRKLVERLGDSDAAVAVRFIAENAPAVDLEQVFKHMGAHTGVKNFDGKAMGPRMSAVGFARNAIGGGVTGPYDTDYVSRKYRMDKKVADALLEEMDAYDNA